MICQICHIDSPIFWIKILVTFWNLVTFREKIENRVRNQIGLVTVHVLKCFRAQIQNQS